MWPVFGFAKDDMEMNTGLSVRFSMSTEYLNTKQPSNVCINNLRIYNNATCQVFVYSLLYLKYNGVMMSSADNEVVLLLCSQASVFTVWLAGPVPRVFLCIIVYLFETNSSTPVLQRDGNKSDSYCEAVQRRAAVIKSPLATEGSTSVGRI